MAEFFNPLKNNWVIECAYKEYFNVILQIHAF